DDEALHTGHLTDLAEGTSSAGLPHFEGRTVRIQGLRQDGLQFALGAVPDLDDHAAALIARDETLVIVSEHFALSGTGLLDDGLLLFRNVYFVDAPGGAGSGGVLEAELLQLVHDRRHGVGSPIIDDVDDDVEEGLLHYHVVDEGVDGRQNAIKEETADRGLEDLVIELLVLRRVGSQYLDPGAEIDDAVVIGVDGVIRRREELALALGAVDDLGHPVGAESHIKELLGHDRLA